MNSQKILDTTHTHPDLPAADGNAIIANNSERVTSSPAITHLLEKKEQLKTYAAKIEALIKTCQSEFSYRNNVQLFLQRILFSIEKLNSVLDVLFEPTELTAHGLNQGRLRHDAGNSINQIVGYTEMLQEDAEEAGALDFVHDLQQIQTIVYNFLDTVNEVSGKTRHLKGDLFFED